jgi:hypothetical protein
MKMNVGWMESLLLVAAASVLCGSTTGAQSRSGKAFARYKGPLKSATLDLATGTITHGPAVSNRVGTTVTDFDNNDLGGFVGVDTGGGFCEWFDAAVKGTGQGRTAGVNNASDMMNSIVFSYCSAALTPGSGGPGGSVRLGFYEGYMLFGGAATTAVSVFTLTGLPANSASSSFFGGFTCTFLRVVFPTLVCFADGPIGYSWRFLDNGTGTLNPLGTVLAATWPFLSCTSSCSGTAFSVDLQGMTDAMDEYCPPGYLRSVSFTFGTTSGSFTSMSMAVEEVVDTTATVALVNSATFPNPDILTSTAAIVGAPFTASLTLGLGRSKGASWILYFGTQSVNPPTGVPLPQRVALNFGQSKGGRMLLCAINTTAFSCTGAHSGVSGSTSVTNCGGGGIPKAINLVNNSWCGQALVLGTVAAVDGGGNARLSSGVTGVVGTQ